VPHKRVELAMRAVAELRERLPGLTLDVVGHGYWEPELRAEAARLGIEDAVRFLGFVDDAAKHELLSTAWLNLLPSLKEGWGLAIVEAAAHGTPSVAFSTAGGTTESVLDGLTGRLVDTDQEFVSAVAGLLSDTVTRCAMGEAARVHASTFSWDATADAVERVLLRVAGRSHDVVRLPVQRPAPLGPARGARGDESTDVDQAL
jgi:glycosyltransferase involved in cell wall biosynthesis